MATVTVTMTMKTFLFCIFLVFFTLHVSAQKKPALSIEVETVSDKVSEYKERGVKNPFAEIGIKSMKIVNKIQLCEDQSLCNEITDFQPSGKYLNPDVLAFYVPLFSSLKYDLGIKFIYYYQY